MKYVKILGLLAIAAAALMAIAGTASATELTSPAGTKVVKGAVVESTSTNSQLTGNVTISCKHSFVKGEVEKDGGTGVTVSGPVTELTFTECNPNTVSVISKGTLEIHSIGKNTGTVTSTGAEVTVLTHNIIGTVHCIYRTNETHIGTLLGSGHKEGGPTATLHITSAPILQTPTDFFCGDSATWDGDYSVLKPDPLIID